MNRVLTAVFLLLVLPVTLLAQDQQTGETQNEQGQIYLEPASAGAIESAVFLPPRFFVGDPVELRVTITPSPGVGLALPAVEPKGAWFQVTAMTLTPAGNSYIFRFQFISFAPGTRSLPPIPLGDVTLSGIKVYTAVFTTDESFQELQDQLFLPGTWLLIGTAAAALLFLPILFIGTGRFLINRGRSLLETHRILRPLRRIRQIIRNLREVPTEPRECYIQLSSALREYLTRRTGTDFSVITMNEFYSALVKDLPRHPGNRQLTNFMDFSDQVKFAGKTASRRRILQDLDVVDEYVSALEQLHKNQPDTEQEKSSSSTAAKPGKEGGKE